MKEGSLRGVPARVARGVAGVHPRGGSQVMNILKNGYIVLPVPYSQPMQKWSMSIINDIQEY